jgi:hypothetical protein
MKNFDFAVFKRTRVIEEVEELGAELKPGPLRARILCREVPTALGK